VERRVTSEFEGVELQGNSFGEWREVRLGIQEGQRVRDDVAGDVSSRERDR
jgi:hypothetical protein